MPAFAAVSPASELKEPSWALFAFAMLLCLLSVSLVLGRAAAKSADVNAKDRLGMTPMMRAARDGRLDDVKDFVEEQGADVDARDKYDETAMMLAARAGQLEVVRYLVEQGADVNAKSKHGFTAMMYAARHGQLEVVKYLTEQGADVNAKSIHGFTAICMQRGMASWRW